MRFGANILFQNVNVQFHNGNRYGLVGANGCGKSTFLKIVIGEVTPESGEVSWPMQLKVGSLKQDHYQNNHQRVMDVILQGKARLWRALELKQTLLDQEHLTASDQDTLAECEKILQEEKGYAAESEAAKLLEGLGIHRSFHEKPLSVLSGGYKLRALLAQLLFSQPDMLLLDEPTNHLDLSSIRWLENYLLQFPGILLISSHDRDFLNRVCTHIVDIDYGTMKIYKGNYEAFTMLKRQERELKELLIEKHTKKRSEIQEFIDRFKAKASKARQAQSKIRLVEKLTDELDALHLVPSSRLYPKIHFRLSRPSGVKVLEVKGVSKAFGSKKVLENVNFEVERGEHIAILGPNGIGKSTLLEILMNHLEADHGGFTWGFATKVAYFPQDLACEVQGEISLLDWLSRVDSTKSMEYLRDLLGKVLFSGDVVHQPVRLLSGGETARLILAKMMLQEPNVLIFDEPTNHLDVEAIDELTRALKAFEGTVLFVSHNRYFVSLLAKRVLEITLEGVKDYKCPYSEYLEKQEMDYLSAQQPIYSKQEQIKAHSSYEDQKKLRNLRIQLKKKVEQAEEACHQLEQALKQLEVKVSQEGFYEWTPLEMQQSLLIEKNRWEEQLMKELELWERLSQELQQVEC
jgi:ATPase subunit of ABC transporter with duplicated ATPase domains